MRIEICYEDYWKTLHHSDRASISRCLKNEENDWSTEKILKEILEYNDKVTNIKFFYGGAHTFDLLKPILFSYEIHANEYTTNAKKVIRIFQRA